MKKLTRRQSDVLWAVKSVHRKGKAKLSDIINWLDGPDKKKNTKQRIGYMLLLLISYGRVKKIGHGFYSYIREKRRKK